MLKRAIGRKGQGEWTDIFLTVVLAVGVLLVAMKIPEIVNSIADLLSLASAERVARDLAGLITISGAASENITIKYAGEDPDITYDVVIEDRMVKITGINIYSEATGQAERIESIGAPAKVGFGKIAVDPEEAFENVRVFMIEKGRSVTAEGVFDIYDVSAS